MTPLLNICAAETYSRIQERQKETGVEEKEVGGEGRGGRDRTLRLVLQQLVCIDFLSLRPESQNLFCHTWLPCTSYQG